MTRRRVIFTDPESGITYTSPEFNGDKLEFERFIGKSGDSCTATWNEIAGIFRPVRTLEEFKAASEAAQRHYISAIVTDTEILLIEKVTDNIGVTADELLFLPVSEDAHPFTDREFKDKMLHADSDTLADFLGRGFLVFDGNGDVTGTINIEAEIDAVFFQMPGENIKKYWLRMLGG